MPKKRSQNFKRFILKLSGEALLGNKDYGIDTGIIEQIARDIKKILKQKKQIGIVIGGGNFFRGSRLNGHNFSRVTGDHLGMLATIINALAIQDVFMSCNIPTQVMSALPIDGIVERYDYRRAICLMEEGKVLIFSGGIGNPLVTTDTALCLRGIELGADLLLKATNVNGIYSADPKKNPQAKFYAHLTYDEALIKNLEVMDLFAFYLGREHKMKLRVFNINKPGALIRIVQGLNEGTLVE